MREHNSKSKIVAPQRECQQSVENHSLAYLQGEFGFQQHTGLRAYVPYPNSARLMCKCLVAGAGIFILFHFRHK